MIKILIIFYLDGNETRKSHATIIQDNWTTHQTLGAILHGQLVGRAEGAWIGNLLNQLLRFFEDRESMLFSASSNTVYITIALIMPQQKTGPLTSLSSPVQRPQQASSRPPPVPRSGQRANFGLTSTSPTSTSSTSNASYKMPARPFSKTAAAPSRSSRHRTSAPGSATPATPNYSFTATSTARQRLTGR